MSKEEKVAQRVRELCREHEISAYELAKRSHMSPSTIRSILNGDDGRNTRISSIFKICCGLKISLAEFFDTDLFLE